MMSFDTVETQIREARERAETFATSLKKAREQEAVFEDERQKWVQSFEEKSIVIEQLERELESTVNALNDEREHDKVNPFAGTTSVLYPPHTSTESSSSGRYPDANKAPLNNQLISASTSHQHPLSPTRAGGSIAINSSHQYAPTASRYSDVNSSNSLSNMIELLQHAQEETNRAKRDATMLRAEKDRMVEQVSSLKRQNQSLTEDRDQLILSCRNTEGKLQFRNEQVRG
jgi:chromosome segregation ATPase